MYGRLLPYVPGCMRERGRKMVERSAFCVSYQTEPGGGTGYTVNYAQQQGLTIIPLSLSQPQAQ